MNQVRDSTIKQVTGINDITQKLMNIENLLCVWCSRERYRYYK